MSPPVTSRAVQAAMEKDRCSRGMPRRARRPAAIVWRQAAVRNTAVAATTPGPAIVTIERKLKPVGLRSAHPRCMPDRGHAGNRQWFRVQPANRTRRRRHNRRRRPHCPLQPLRRCLRPRPPNRGEPSTISRASAASLPQGGRSAIGYPPSSPYRLRRLFAPDGLVGSARSAPCAERHGAENVAAE
jgi:hypothetical protein